MNGQPYATPITRPKLREWVLAGKKPDECPVYEPVPGEEIFGYKAG